ncbi:alpha/beta hydrolase [Dactylosporangium vinaceum]|uniref:Alpha/beta fold hydrolase n=1 Tax=Dactylosporangium vinaceum TaxID=53362 RepID=A0ABV5M6L5_9ACTN|nr:alpha/beta hydrolase [Dactylosporangium vinaceum]UAB97893.1 alpha/beta hydrolase [Dactylosporangium vinaceum]
MSDLTIVLVHGAFAESASWAGVVPPLRAAGHTVVAVANPLRSLSGDAAAVSAVVREISGPVLLVGHSYGGAVISNASGDNVRGLVFAAAFAPAQGESIAELSGRLPGSTLGGTLHPVPLPDGSTDLYIRQELFPAQFAADVPAAEAAVLAATQRPLRDVALNEASGPPSWPSLPSWFVFPDADLNIPVAMHREMAARAGARDTVELAGASHALTVSRPAEVAEVVLKAAAAVA